MTEIEVRVIIDEGGTDVQVSVLDVDVNIDIEHLSKAISKAVSSAIREVADGTQEERR